MLFALVRGFLRLKASEVKKRTFGQQAFIEQILRNEQKSFFTFLTKAIGFFSLIN